VTVRSGALGTVVELAGGVAIGGAHPAMTTTARASPVSVDLARDLDITTPPVDV